MKLALLGDIHGNSSALEAVLSKASKLQVDALLVTGDLVGYYFYPLAVLAQLEPWACHIVRGNHEEMLSRCRYEPDFGREVRRRYGSGIDEALKQLSDAQIEMLSHLPGSIPIVVDGRRILLCHGAPHDTDFYIYPDSDLLVLKEQGLAEFDVVVMGHTHYPMRRELHKNTLLVNPGSVGQPRNRQPGAHWALYNTRSGEVIFHCEDYDFSDLQAEVRRRHPELPYLADVLGRI